jgi:hypothetical protein
MAGASTLICGTHRWIPPSAAPDTAALLDRARRAGAVLVGDGSELHVVEQLEGQLHPNNAASAERQCRRRKSRCCGASIGIAWRGCRLSASRSATGGSGDELARLAVVRVVPDVFGEKVGMGAGFPLDEKTWLRR